MSETGDIAEKLGLGTALDPEAPLWAAFATAGNTDAVCRSWLALQCRLLPGVSAATLLLSRGGPFQPVAVWPDARQDLSFLKPVAEQCVQSGEPVVLRPTPGAGDTGIHLAYPFLADGDRPVGVVVLELQARPEPELRRAMRSLHWGLGWLEAQAVRERIDRERQRVAAAAAALDLVAVANGHERAEAAAMAVANELAVRLGAARVAVGLDSGRGARLIALSQTAWFKRQTAMARAMENAMDEAIDQRAIIRLPADPAGSVRIQVAHEVLREVWDAGAACTTFPLVTERGPVGAITVLHQAMPPDAALRLGDAACALLGPLLDSKRRARRLLSGRLVDGVLIVLAALVGPRHIAWKLAGATALAAATAAVLVPTDFRVTAEAVLEGEVQRAVPVPFDGFIATAPVHAGDRVRAGDVLATMDDRDLQVERVKWSSEHQRLQLKQREAMAKHDPATAGQIAAQLRQTEAEADLNAAKLARSLITSPLDGLVVSGDLSQQIGSPVETGKVLFEVAPLDAYRVIVHLGERDAGFVHPGQHGTVLLHGLTGTPLPFSVRGVSSVAEVENGRNTFRVEGTLDAAPPSLRPGMEGVGKVEVDRRSYAAVWTRGLVDWLRMLAWTWLP